MKRILIVLLALLLVFAMLACGEGTPLADVDEEILTEMPADLVAFVDEELATIDAIGIDLSGEWGDMHADLMATVEGDTYDETLYADLKTALDEHRIANGAYYVYVMIPDENNEYHITVDGSADPDDFMTNYGWEVQFDEAWTGNIATARSGWDDDVPIWSSFAPVYNSSDEVICIVGIDMPCEILEDYPEWNRDRDEWNGIEE